MRVRTYIILLLGLVALHQPTNGQNIKDDFRKMRSAFSETDQWCLTIDYKLFKDKFKSKLLENEQTEMIKNGSVLYSKMADVEQIQSKDYLVRIDYENTYIMIDESQRTEEIENLFVENMDSLWNHIEEWFTMELKGDEVIYHIRSQYGNFDYVQVIRKSDSFRITKIVYERREKMEYDGEMIKPVLEMVFDYDGSCSYENYTTALINNYINLDLNSMSQTAKYESFEFINLLEQ